MLTEEQQSLVNSWLTFKRHWWAFETLDNMCRDNPEEAWLIVVALVAAADPEDLLGDIGAGPLEDLLSEHGAAFVERAEAAARTNPRFAKALSNVWLSEKDSEAAQRLLAIGCQFVAPAE